MWQALQYAKDIIGAVAAARSGVLWLVLLMFAATICYIAGARPDDIFEIIRHIFGVCECALPPPIAG